MISSLRSVTPEILDNLAPEDARARHSRGDLRRLHRIMGSAGILGDAIGRIWRTHPPQRIIELGAGDGTLMLRVARELPPSSGDVDLVLLDRHDLVDRATVDGYAAIGWAARVVKLDVLDWARDPIERKYDLCVASLFLHHFGPDELQAAVARH